jgi:serpin B
MMLCINACKSDDTGLKEEAPVTPPVENTPDEPSVPVNPRKDIVLTEGEEAVVISNNTFAFNLLKEVFRNETEKQNIFLSPLSASLALAMANNGAAGITRAEIQSGLGYEGIDTSVVNSYFKTMVKEMTELDLTTTLESANSIWINDDFPIYKTFQKVNQENYEAEVRNLDFTNPNSLEVFNGWIAEKTHDRIPKMLNELSGVTILANALWFNGIWTVPFDAELTKEATFYNEDGATSKVKMMDFGEEKTFNYTRTQDYEAVELPYGNEAFSMVLILPDKTKSVGEIVENLDASVFSRLGGTKVTVRLPSFKMEYARALNDDLDSLGMKSMFNSKADFSLLSPASLFVSLVFQKTFLDVNEAGTEATAATVIIFDIVSPGEGTVATPILEFNRPFVFLIKERSTGSIIFAGVVRGF